MNKIDCEKKGGKFIEGVCTYKNPKKMVRGFSSAGGRVSKTAGFIKKGVSSYHQKSRDMPKPLKGVVPQSLFYGLGLALLLLGLWLGGFMLFVTLGFVVLAYVVLNGTGLLKEQTGSDAAILMVEFVIFAVALLFLGLSISVPWWKIIVVALLAEGLAFLTGFLPVVGDYAGAILIFLLTFLVFDGFPGLVYGLIGGFLALIPFSIPGLILIAYLLVKLLTSAFGGVA